MGYCWNELEVNTYYTYLYTWEQRRLGEVADFFDEKRIPIDSGLRKAGEYPYYGASGVIDYVHDYIFDGEYVLLAEDGANIIMRNSPIAYLTNGKFWLNNHAHIMRMKDGDNSFLLQILEKQNYVKYNTGTAQPKLNSEVVKNMVLTFPLFEEQAKIGNFFNQLDKAITLHQRKLEQLTLLKRTYLQMMFPDKEQCIPRLRFTDFGEVWEQRKLKDSANIITKGTTPKDKSGKGSVNFVKVENISDSHVQAITKISEKEHEGYLKRSKLEEGDVLFSIAGTLGRTAVVNKEILPANTNQALAIVRGHEFDVNFLVTSLSGKIVTDYIRKNPTVGAQPNLSLAQVGDLTITHPSYIEQEKIGNFTKNINHIIDSYQKKLDLLQILKKAYLQKMFI